jgi:hypothetical protein
VSDSERVLRQLAEELVVAAAEKAAAGQLRLTVLHGLAPEQEAELVELVSFVDDVCRHHSIATYGGVFTGQYPVGQHPRTRWTRWIFGPPDAAADLAVVRAALAERYPGWPIEADES